MARTKKSVEKRRVGRMRASGDSSSRPPSKKQEYFAAAAPGYVVPGSEGTWAQALPNLRFNFEVRALQRESEVEQRKENEALQKQSETVCKVNEQRETTTKIANRLVEEASEEELTEYVNTADFAELRLFGEAIGRSKRFPMLTPGCRAHLIRQLSIRLPTHSRPGTLTAIYLPLLDHVLSHGNSFSPVDLLSAAFGLSRTGIRKSDVSALVSSVMADIGPVQVPSLSDDEFKWFCSLISNYTEEVSAELAHSLKSRLEAGLDEMDLDILIPTSRLLCRNRRVMFGPKVLARLDARIGAAGVPDLPTRLLCNFAHVCLQHSKEGFLPKEVDFASELRSRVKHLMDWELVLLSRTSIVCNQMTSPVMQHLVSFLQSKDDDVFYLASPDLIGYFLSALTFREFSLPEIGQLARLVVGKLKLEKEVANPRDAIHLLRDLTKLNALPRDKQVAVVFDTAVSDMSVWRPIDMCVLLETVCLLQVIRPWQSRRCASYLYEHAHRCRPVLQPFLLSTVVNTCRFIADLRWTTCPWLETYVPFVASHIHLLLDEKFSKGLASRFFVNITSLKVPFRKVLAEVSSTMEKNGIVSMFRSRSHQIAAIWACAVQGETPSATLDWFVRSFQYDDFLFRSDQDEMFSQLFAMTRVYNSQPAPSALVSLLKKRNTSRSVAKCIRALCAVLGDGFVSCRSVVPEGLLLPASLILDSSGCPVAWQDLGMDPSTVSARSMLKKGLVPIAVMPLEESHHSADRKQILALPETKCQLLEQFGWQVMTPSLPALRLAQTSTLSEDPGKDEEAVYRELVKQLLVKAGARLSSET